jgi:hypothetical protein
VYTCVFLICKERDVPFSFTQWRGVFSYAAWERLGLEGDAEIYSLFMEDGSKIYADCEVMNAAIVEGKLLLLALESNDVANKYNNGKYIYNMLAT